MSVEWWLGLLLFAFVTTITPGPNNLLLLASGMNVGTRRSRPFLAGIVAAFTLLVAAAGLGLAAAVAAAPLLESLIRYGGCAYLALLAWKLAGAGPVAEAGGAPRLLRFRDGVGFQLLNPKAWMMALTATALYAPGGATAPLAAVAGVFLLVGAPCNLVWLLGGSLLGRLQQDAARIRQINRLLALLLLASVLPVLLGWD